MLRRFSCLCAMLAVALVASTASANVIVRATSPSGTNFNLGQTYTINIEVVALAPGLTVGGVGFDLNSGSGGQFVAPATTNAAVADFGWIPAAFPQTTMLADFATKPAEFGFTDNVPKLFGSITFSATTLGNNFQMSFDNPLLLDAGSLEIPNSGAQGFSYNVVPEPSSALLGGLALAGLAFRRRRS